MDIAGIWILQVQSQVLNRIRDGVFPIFKYPWSIIGYGV